MRYCSATLLSLSVAFLVGCESKSSVQRLEEACVAQLEKVLPQYSERYKRWDKSNIKSHLVLMRPDRDKNLWRPENDRKHHHFEVIITDFLIEDQSGRKALASAVCSGNTSVQSSNGVWKPHQQDLNEFSIPSELNIALRMTL